VQNTHPARGLSSRYRATAAGSLNTALAPVRFILTCLPRLRTFVIAAGLAWSAFLLQAPDAAGAETKRILLLHSFGRDFEPWSAHSRKLKEELSRLSSWPLDIQSHEIVSARNLDGSPEPILSSYLKALYANDPLHLVVTIGAPAALFGQRYRQDLFSTTPLLLSAVDRRFVQQVNLSDNDVAVATAIDLPATFKNIQRLLPKTNKIFGLLGASPLEQVWLGAARKELAFLEGHVEVVWLTDLSFEDMLKTVAEAPPNSAVFWGPVRVDSAGVSHPGDIALERLFAASRAPIFSYHDAFFRGQTVGGPMIDTAMVERRTAEVAVRLLNGEKPGDIRVEPVVDFVPRYDWRQLQRWDISESRLPPGSEILFREPSVWTRYRRELLLVALALLIQSLLITALIYQRRQRAVAEVQSRQRMAELAHVNRRTVAGELTASISHELNQPLGATLINAEAIQLMLNTQPLNLNEIKQTAADIKRDNERASEVLRRLRSLLKKAPFEPKLVDLRSVVQDTTLLIDPVMRLRKVSLSSNIPDIALRCNADPVQLQQVIINLILNAADAVEEVSPERRQIAVGLRREATEAEIWISDRGPGIPADKINEIFEPFMTSKKGGMGMGLSIVRTIVQAHRGTVSARNLNGGGAVFVVRLPLV
jgi:signal transduction histidine kinase